MAARAPELVPAQRTFDALYGLELLDRDGDALCARVAVRDAVKQMFGLVHGGLYASVAESLASRGTYEAVADAGMQAMGISNHTSFLRPVTEGHVHAVATPQHRGRTTWVWEIDFHDDRGRRCALSRVTIAVRPLPS